jgi:hypothetical protein
LNCSQARTLLAAYRELKKGQMDTTALEVHLSSCAACRTYLTQSSVVGERLRALPAIKPPADARTKLMKELATEHARFIQNAPASAQSTPVPAFLAPYLKEHAQETANNIAAFSTADTGPLPVIQAPAKRRNAHFHMSHFAVVALAAAFLMVIMAGGLTSLVILANRGVQEQAPASFVQLSQITLTNYTTQTTYSHIASAVADRQNIYYTASNDLSTGWTLAVLDNQTKVSTQLISKESASPLVVLSSSDDWLIWLQYDLPKKETSKNTRTHSTTSHEVRTWSLKATYIGTDPASTLTTSTPITLSKGTFDLATAPSWINTPIPGTWLTKDTLLVTSIDAKGKSHLTRYELNAEKNPQATQLATVGDGHVLTSPTANSDDTSIYWSEEWMSEDTVLHSSIWAQKITPTALPLHGKWMHQTTTNTYQFSTDSTFFHPQVVNDTLFVLNVKTTNAVTSPQATASATTTPDATATATAQQNAMTLPRTDPTIYGVQPDTQLQGTLQTFSALDDSPVQMLLNSTGTVQALQAGSRFILWQNSNNKGISMYDVVAMQPVIVGADAIPNNTALLAVNGDTAVWTNSPTSAATSTPDTGTSITFSTFNWPTRSTAATGQ